MVLDWEEHKALRVGLEQWLVCLLRLDCGCNLSDYFLDLGLEVDSRKEDGFCVAGLVNDVVDWRVGFERDVLLSGSGEVELLNR
jgi:hypothetical protein